MILTIFLVLFLVTLISIELRLREQVKQSKELEIALYRLIEITKEQKWRQ